MFVLSYRLILQHMSLKWFLSIHIIECDTTINVASRSLSTCFSGSEHVAESQAWATEHSYLRMHLAFLLVSLFVRHGLLYLFLYLSRSSRIFYPSLLQNNPRLKLVCLCLCRTFRQIVRRL
jgi:hypothetical protein